MKLSYLKKLWPLLLLGVMSLYGCKDDDDEPAAEQNLYVVLDSEVGLDSFARAINLSGYKLDLQSGNLRVQDDGGNMYTVFAPNNAAFSSMMSTLGVTNLDQIPNNVLRRALSTHFMRQEVYSGDLATPDEVFHTIFNYMNDSDNNSDYYGYCYNDYYNHYYKRLKVTIDNGMVKIGKLNCNQNNQYEDARRVANIIKTDIKASNAVVHVVDNILEPYGGSEGDTGTQASMN